MERNESDNPLRVRLALAQCRAVQSRAEQGRAGQYLGLGAGAEMTAAAGPLSVVSTARPVYEEELRPRHDSRGSDSRSSCGKGEGAVKWTGHKFDTKVVEVYARRADAVAFPPTPHLARAHTHASWHLPSHNPCCTPTTYLLPIHTDAT